MSEANAKIVTIDEMKGIGRLTARGVEAMCRTIMTGPKKVMVRHKYEAEPTSYVVVPTGEDATALDAA